MTHQLPDAARSLLRSFTTGDLRRGDRVERVAFVIHEGAIVLAIDSVLLREQGPDDDPREDESGPFVLLLPDEGSAVRSEPGTAALTLYARTIEEPRFDAGVDRHGAYHVRQPRGTWVRMRIGMARVCPPVATDSDAHEAPHTEPRDADRPASVEMFGADDIDLTNPLATIEARVLGEVNRHEALRTELVRCARPRLGEDELAREVGGARVVGLDDLGLDVRVAHAVHRLAFDTPAPDEASARHAIERLAQQRTTRTNRE
ncbi:MAG: hypothetical protein RBS39_09115 [Phycisphaerales bacterium]|jgi:hypothetical protein|nr:hypothetical protein [Phycisphaerales bacterium]